MSFKYKKCPDYKEDTNIFFDGELVGRISKGVGCSSADQRKRLEKDKKYFVKTYTLELFDIPDMPDHIARMGIEINTNGNARATLKTLKQFAEKMVSEGWSKEDYMTLKESRV